MRDPGPLPALTDPSAELCRGFAGLDAARRLLLAVSGGPDSMALLHLAVSWARTCHPSPMLSVATVDHGLRPEAAAEAEMVAAAAARLGLPHARLDWTGPKPATRLQERARAARYALLGAEAERLGASHILTAHHADDQAETVLLRLGRGSGLGGLAGMRPVVPLTAPVMLARPLLAARKAELIAVCQANAIPFVDDPSNRDETFARARLRRRRQDLADVGLDTAGLVRLARRMARADAALDAETSRVAARLGLGAAAVGERIDLDLAPHRDLQPEIALRLLRRAVAVVVPEAVIRLDRLEALAEAIWAALAAGTAHRATLAGARVRLDAAGRLTVFPEAIRRRGRRD